MTDTATPETPDAPPPDPNAVNITVNGRPHVARKGQLLIDAAKDESVGVVRALDEARALAAEEPRGPLHGIPIGVKDTKHNLMK